MWKIVRNTLYDVCTSESKQSAIMRDLDKTQKVSTNRCEKT
ncbi:hypothetical protein HMPREF1582_00748 [Gardnerella vaginalis JCP8151A]|nr:hypothetical protein HMPREF1582_00748 [Gardnerella vaginalis JCP8151A]